ncbi:DUF4254 domain-containing protein [Planctomycetaceae bacterium SH139]
MNWHSQNPLLDPSILLALQSDCIDRWHRGPLEHDYRAGLALVADQLVFNFQLWHEEDQARSPDASDATIANVKRSIDRLNQQRHDAIEKIDEWIADQLASQPPNPDLADAESLPLNSETPGSVIDRLGILTLRIYHLREQHEREEIDDKLRASIEQKLIVCQQQQQDLAIALKQLLDDLCQGRKRHKTYRQLKMYNDPNLNPFLYRSRKGLT